MTASSNETQLPAPSEARLVAPSSVPSAAAGGSVAGLSSAAASPAVLAAVYQQNWENARHIKSERIWFMNVYSIIAAGILSLLHSIRGAVVLECALIGFMCIFSGIGLLTSFRLKAELEECLEKLQALVQAARLEPWVALGQSEGALSHFPKFRWVFPVFYALTTGAFLGLLGYRLVSGQPAGW